MDLEALAVAIRDAHRAATVGALEHARGAGDLLIQAKLLLNEHGTWLPWIEANLSISVDTVGVYMRVAKYWPLIDVANSERARISSIREALELIKRFLKGDSQDDEDALGPGGHDGAAPSGYDEDHGEDATTTRVTFHLSPSECEEFIAFAKPHPTQKAAFLHAIRHRCEK